MKRFATLALAAILTCGICESAYAQTVRTVSSQRQRGVLTEQQKKDLDIAVRKKVSNLTEQIKKIANKRYTNREKFVKEARRNFINYCLPYFDYTTDTNGNILKKVKNTGVKMEIANATRDSFTVTERLMRVYFYNLMKLNYKTVKITNTDFVNMKSTEPEYIGLDKDGNEIFKCMVIYVQRFEAQTYENLRNGDDTTKYVEVIIKKIEILDANNEKDYTFSIILGNVLVDKLEKIDPNKNIELLPDEDNLLY